MSGCVPNVEPVASPKVQASGIPEYRGTCSCGWTGTTYAARGGKDLALQEAVAHGRGER